MLGRYPLATDWISKWHNGKWLQAMLGPFVELLGEPAVVGILGSFYMVSLFWYTRSIYPVAVVIVFFGSSFLLRAPGPVATVGGLVVTIALALAYLAIYRGGQTVR